MSYIVFARKWRPQTFDDVAGQEHITTTLKNAIKSDRVAHAYLFSGPRGVGKTTTARLLAKALNCEKGPTPMPCNTCAICEGITEGSNLDIIEIDGASNRGIDDIRALRDNVKLSPQQGRFKIYIIDEVHMLTSEAFNALLKTLEEPPSHVRFIFATTAVHKVIPTIVSRCQHFNFRKLSFKEIADKLKKIAESEKVKCEDIAMLSIVKAASGSMRDAESIFDQMVTYSGADIKADDVNRILGYVAADLLNDFCKYIIEKDASSAISLLAKIMDDGKDPEQFLLGLIDYFRNAMILKEANDADGLLDISKDETAQILKVIEPLSREDILYILYSLVNTAAMIKRTSSARIILELLTVKLSQKDSVASLSDILERLKVLEKGAVSNMGFKPKPNLPVIEQKMAEEQLVKKAAVLSGELESGDKPQLYKVKEAMPKILSIIKKQKIYIASCLAEGRIQEYKDNIITIGFFEKDSFHKESIESNENKKMVEAAFSEVLGSKVVVEFIILKKTSEPNSSKGGLQQDNKNDLKTALSDPIIKDALDIFDGSIMKFM